MSQASGAASRRLPVPSNKNSWTKPSPFSWGVSPVSELVGTKAALSLRCSSRGPVPHSCFWNCSPAELKVNAGLYLNWPCRWGPTKGPRPITLMVVRAVVLLGQAESGTLSVLATSRSWHLMQLVWRILRVLQRSAEVYRVCLSFITSGILPHAHLCLIIPIMLLMCCLPWDSVDVIFLHDPLKPAPFCAAHQPSRSKGLHIFNVSICDSCIFSFWMERLKWQNFKCQSTGGAAPSTETSSFFYSRLLVHHCLQAFPVSPHNTCGFISLTCVISGVD